MRKTAGLLAFLLIIALSSSLVTPVLAQGIFDMPCPTCGGKGWIWQDQTCPTCGGAGEITATITRTSLDARWVAIGFNWFLEITGTFHNEEGQGTYGTVYAYTQRYQEIYDEGRKRVWFPAHESVTVAMTVDIASDGADWHYNMYVESSDPITCPTCGGDGKVTVQATCPTCGGSGYVTNWVAVGGTGVVILATVAVVIFALRRYAFAMRRREKQTPKTKTEAYPPSFLVSRLKWISEGSFTLLTPPSLRSTSYLAPYSPTFLGSQG